MPKNHAKAKLRAGECVYGTSVEYCLDPEISLLLKKAGLDLFFIDTEHQTASYADIRAICRTKVAVIGRTAGLAGRKTV